VQKYFTIGKYLNVIFTFWCDNNEKANLVGFTKHYNAWIVVKVLLSINCIIKLSSFITAIQHEFTLWQLQLVTQRSDQQSQQFSTSSHRSVAAPASHTAQRSTVTAIQHEFTPRCGSFGQSHTAAINSHSNSARVHTVARQLQPVTQRTDQQSQQFSTSSHRGSFS